MTQRIITSKDFSADLLRVLDELCIKRILLVCDAAFNYLPIKNVFDGLSAVVAKFSDFTSNPQYVDVCKGVLLYSTEHCDAIVAVGGGSAIDVAKCIKLFCKLDPAVNYLRQDYTDSGVPLIAVPTTAGTGSESTRYAVIYYEGKKRSVTHGSIVPNYALLAHTVLHTLPLYQKKCTMLDALCQGIESWWSVNSTDASKLLSHQAVSLIVRNIDKYIFDNADTVAEQIMLAANIAGQAINITQTTAPHAMSYKLTSLYNLPHGHTVALCFPEVWRYMLTHPENCVDPRGEEYLLKVFQEIAECFGCNNALEAVEWFANMMRKLDIGAVVTKNPDDGIAVLVNSVNITRLANNPVTLSKDALRAMYERIVINEG